MRVFRGFEGVPKLRNPIVTMGVYDGVHVGHREILSKLKNEAKKQNGESVVITFEPHPRVVLGSGEIKLLTTLQEKIVILERLGIDNLIVVSFDREFSQITSHDFVRNYLIDKLDTSMLVVGYDHHFGRDRDGNFDYLTRLKDEFGFEVVRVSAKLGDGKEVGSTLIRELVGGGEMGKAAELLGEPYMLVGSYRAGELEVVDAHKLLPATGKYPIKIKQDGGDIESELLVGADGKLSISTKYGLEEGEQIQITFI